MVNEVNLTSTKVAIPDPENLTLNDPVQVSEMFSQMKQLILAQGKDLETLAAEVKAIKDRLDVGGL